MYEIQSGKGSGIQPGQSFMAKAIKGLFEHIYIYIERETCSSFPGYTTQHWTNLGSAMKQHYYYYYYYYYYHYYIPSWQVP